MWIIPLRLWYFCPNHTQNIKYCADMFNLRIYYLRIAIDYTVFPLIWVALLLHVISVNLHGYYLHYQICSQSSFAKRQIFVLIARKLQMCHIFVLSFIFILYFSLQLKDLYLLSSVKLQNYKNYKYVKLIGASNALKLISALTAVSSGSVIRSR